MSEPSVWITADGRVVIDSAAWIGHRVRGSRPDLVADLHAWLDSVDTLDDGETVRDWTSVSQAWCTARGHDVREPGLIVHEQTRLDARLWVLLLDAADGSRVAVVGINHEPPTLYSDGTSEPWVWCDADSVVITCPGGHSWTWRAGRELVTATGRPATLTTVFGPNLDAPFSACPTCAAYQLGTSTIPCECDGSPWIVCPICDRRCELRLPNP